MTARGRHARLAPRFCWNLAVVNRLIAVLLSRLLPSLLLILLSVLIAAPVSGSESAIADAASTEDATGDDSPQTQRAQWELGIGGTAVHIPHYIGADEARDYLLPFPYFVYHGKRWNVDRNFIYGKLLERGKLKIDLSLSGTPPVDSEDNQARAGMPDLDATGEIGPSIQYTWHQDDDTVWRTDLAIRKVVSTDFRSLDDAGHTFSPQLYFSQRWQTEDAARWQFESTVGPAYGDDRFHDFFYEVAPQYATSERAAYSPDGGFGGWRLATGITRRKDNFWFGAFVRYYDLSDAVFVDSPLVKHEHSLLVGVAFAWILQSNKTP